MSPAHQLGRTGAVAFGLCLVAWVSARLPSAADETATAPAQITATPVHRPRIGLVLAGGGARRAARTSA